MDDFSIKFLELISKINEKGKGVLATSFKDQVTARTISVVVYDEKIAFQTSSEMEKFQQLKENPNVAFCVENIQVTGVATIKNSPLEEEKFAGLYKEKHPTSFDNYATIPSERVVEIQIQTIKSWIYKEKEPFILTLDNVRKEQTLVAYKE